MVKHEPVVMKYRFLYYKILVLVDLSYISQQIDFFFKLSWKIARQIGESTALFVQS